MTAGGFQMTEDYFEPPLEETDFVLLDVEDVCIALRVVVACEACYPESEIPFDWIMDQVTNGVAMRMAMLYQLAGVN